MQFASQYIYICQCLHVSGCFGPIIRKRNCVSATLGTCYSVWMTVWYAGAYASAYQTVHQVGLFTRLKWILDYWVRIYWLDSAGSVDVSVTCLC